MNHFEHLVQVVEAFQATFNPANNKETHTPKLLESAIDGIADSINTRDDLTKEMSDWDAGKLDGEWLSLLTNELIDDTGTVTDIIVMLANSRKTEAQDILLKFMESFIERYDQRRFDNAVESYGHD